MPANARSAIIIGFTTREDWFENLLSPEHDRSGLEENIPVLTSEDYKAERQVHYGQLSSYFVAEMKIEIC